MVAVRAFPTIMEPMYRAFSLVELSIVLVILGLLTGGILAGQSLIRASELRAVSSEYQRYAAAVQTFRGKYMGLPGDLTNAVSFWTSAASCPGNNTTTAGGTCNGNGDGRLGPLNTANYGNEIYRAWQHLAFAGLIEGSYAGVTNHTSSANVEHAAIGYNVPASRYGNAGWTFYSFGSPRAISETSYFEGDYGTFLFFGGANGTNVTFQPIIKPEEAWGIDSKMDDGKPATGAVRTREADGGTTSSACSDLAASNTLSLAASNYSLSNTGNNCSLMMMLGI